MSDGTSNKPVALIVGAGDATGAAIAQRFAAGGFNVCVSRRRAEKLAPLVEAVRAQGYACHGYPSDARDEAAVIDLFETIERDHGPIEIAIFNAGANVWFPITETTTRTFTKVWEMACLGGFLVGREAACRMVSRGRGSIFFTGATASLRGRAMFSAFASAKHGLRAVAQSMARELGPKGIHVAHLVVDGAIDTAFIRETFPAIHAKKATDGILDPSAIAETYWMLHAQPRNAWTHEMDLRPWSEDF